MCGGGRGMGSGGMGWHGMGLGGNAGKRAVTGRN